MNGALAVAITAIEFVGALLVFGHVIGAAWILMARKPDIKTARLMVADGALWGLSFKVGATLLKTVQVHSWTQIALFAAILAMRTVLKTVFATERRWLDGAAGAG
ncbi:MAG: DUF1622 domain-containing protein [Candidatus Eremiobacteraeota bacterium]|nr:DUF1622 domain-containing protein [Candidatus Eremiobacteraeota bacterium]